MKKTLFINACVRPESRTRMLAQHALDRMGGEITEVDLGKENIEPLRLERLELRNALQEKRGRGTRGLLVASCCVKMICY